MQRRTVLRGLAALAAGAGAGCTSVDGQVPATAPDPPADVRRSSDDGSSGDGGAGGSDGSSDDGGGAGDETPDKQRFAVPARAFRSDDDGDLVVEITVENRSEIVHNAVMTVHIRAGDKTFTPSRHVALEAGAQTTLSVHVPVPMIEFETDPGFDVTFDPGPPETPIPEGTVTPYPEDRETATAGDTDATAGSPTATPTAQQSE
ncbi:hypothetical protein [Halosimplex salinum]|uniref:hypothetical protein n=1 Tax=Halosimplex salinum TaxID=1710538 RepID=UPI000F48C779|nr:hypothetical protein [Halosimplex salinum]